MPPGAGGEVPKALRCAATGKPLYMPVVTLHGVAYSYLGLFEMFMNARGLPVCKETGESIPFFPSVCLPLHHYMLEEFKGQMKGRKQQDEADFWEKYGFQMPVLADATELEGDDGLIEELICVVSGELAYEPCVLSSGSIVSAHCVPEGGFQRDPDRLVACALYGQAPRKSTALETIMKARFPQEYAQRGSDVARQGASATSRNASGTWTALPGDAQIFLGVACDGCGIWPVRSEAWYDEDCPDRAGFHLCGPCYRLGYHKRVITGRFNQTHMPKHRMAPMEQSGLF